LNFGELKMIVKPKLPTIFVDHAADVLGDTDRGLSGAEIARATRAYAVDFDVSLPHPDYPFLEAPNKRTALAANIAAFPDVQRYQIISELCDHPTIQLKNREAARKLKMKLMARYGDLATEHITGDVAKELVDQTRHWLAAFPDALQLYDEALKKYQAGLFLRNVLDDARLSLEVLLRSVLQNEKSLDKQLGALGQLVRSSKGSAEFCNMFSKLVDYYAKYQNTYIKHSDAVVEVEVEFVLEMTSTFMKHLVRLGGEV
jgi:hypothetical protein